ncbi:hypothetical protein FACS1894163_03580 [Spirochaetia bacterium]|nr:hypothetical protein FACS1894163_03580 [Spirochaetia bacterium]
MVCFQVSVQFAFLRHKPVLVSTSIKKQTAPVRLVLLPLPYGHGLKYRRFFKTKKEADQYVSHLKAIYTGRTVPPSALSGGQLSLF